MLMSTFMNEEVPAGSMTSTSRPKTPPMTMMPSMAMLMMPECSEKQAPRATSIRTMP